MNSLCYLPYKLLKPSTIDSLNHQPYTVCHRAADHHRDADHVSHCFFLIAPPLENTVDMILTNSNATYNIQSTTMGRVKPKLGAETTKEGSISLAIKVYQSGAYPSIRQAAESQGLPYSTPYGRLKGRQSHKKAHEID